MGTDVFMECKVLRLVHDADGRDRRLRRLLARRPASSSTFERQGRHPRDRRRRQVLEVHVELVGAHRRRPRHGAVGRRPADRHGVHPVPPDRHGLAAQRARAARHRGRARRRRRAAQLRGRALHVQLRRRHVPRRDRRHRGGGRPLVRRPRRRPPPARAPAARRGRARDQHRGQGRARARPHGGVFLDIAIATHAPSSSGAACPRCTTSSWSSPASTSRASRWRSARPATTSWAASRSTPTPRRRASRGSSPPARSPAACTAPTASAATR